jgi:hypothetical protein
MTNTYQPKIEQIGHYRPEVRKIISRLATKPDIEKDIEKLFDKYTAEMLNCVGETRRFKELRRNLERLTRCIAQKRTVRKWAEERYFFNAAMKSAKYWVDQIKTKGVTAERDQQARSYLNEAMRIKDIVTNSCSNGLKAPKWISWNGCSDAIGYIRNILAESANFLPRWLSKRHPKNVERIDNFKASLEKSMNNYQQKEPTELEKLHSPLPVPKLNIPEHELAWEEEERRESIELLERAMAIAAIDINKVLDDYDRRQEGASPDKDFC